MYLNRQVIIAMIVGMILGWAVIIIGGFQDTEPGTLKFLYLGLVSGLIGLIFGLFYRYILKSKRPETVRRQKIELKDERNIVIRDRTGYKTLLYMMGMLTIAFIIREWVGIEYDYIRITMNIVFISWLIFFAHTHYYRKRL